jgi:ATP-dependent protease HslVU (ClpYQ) peptidase subunit
MSIVACRILENGFDIVADSITTRGNTQTKGQTTTRSKLFEVNEMIIGGVGFARESALFHLFAKTHTPVRADESGFLEYLSEFSDWKKKKTNDANLENSYLVGYRGKVFVLNQWLVEEVRTFEAIGAGERFALAALHLGHSAEKAVETAIELSIYCEYPIQVKSFRVAVG